MSDGQNSPSTPPITKPPAGTRQAAPTAATAGSPPPAAGVSRAALIWIGVAVVVLSFVASFLGATLARSNDEAAAPVPVPTASETQPSTEDYEAALEEILPAGAAVRAGTGAPETGKGYEGEVYIDISTSDVYLFQDDEWVQVGNIRASAAENLTGETGAAGAAGEAGQKGATGASGAPGAPGTQLSLGIGAPQDKTCSADGDVYIDTETVQFYECAAGKWTLFGPPAGEAPAPAPTEGSDG